MPTGNPIRIVEQVEGTSRRVHHQDVQAVIEVVRSAGERHASHARPKCESRGCTNLA